MDLSRIESLNEIRTSVYRVSLKLLSLQKLCHLDVVYIRHVTTAFQSVGGVNVQLTARMNRQEVTQVLHRMFLSVSQQLGGDVSVEATEETCSVMFTLCERSGGQDVSAASLQTALIALSADTLSNKYRALVSVAEKRSGSVSRAGLRSLLQDLSQVPAAVQEEGVFGSVEAAVRSCFNRVLSPTAGEDHLLSWLQSEPRLLLWLPTLYRLYFTQNVRHTVRCHTCKTQPITGLRYRCMKCLNVHMCQSCFLTDRQTRKHKTHHPVLEFCTQPTWRESYSSLVQSARHALLPRRYTQRETDRRRALMWVEPGETTNRVPPPSDPLTRLANLTTSHSLSFDRDVSHNATVQPPSYSSSSKALQTDDDTHTQQNETSALKTEVKNLQRDKWLLEQQLQAWQLTVQSDQSILEDKCTDMEVTMETMREQNLKLQGMLTQALDKMEAQQHASNTPSSFVNRNAEEEKEEEEEQEWSLVIEDKWQKDEQPTQSPTMHRDIPLSLQLHYEEKGEESEEDQLLCLLKEDGAEEVESQEEDTCLCGEEEDGGTCSAEELLQDTVERLRTVLQADRGRERHTGDRKGACLLESADQVGDSIRHLVDAVRTNSKRS
ncbi:dystrotelin isoform X2 [Labrus bergylta]|uniref:dystrotelin isoform X2 n=1 Tax=Labrus bergylta TaxID=56723 RepID=UPI003314261D